MKDRAAAGRGAIRPYSDQFRVVGSTAAVDARDNRAPPAGVPIYWLNGAKVADHYADFYNDSWDSLTGKNELGQAGFSPIPAACERRPTTSTGSGTVKYGSLSSN